ncbi:Uncharacterised protein [Klebsiella pneumoniae]|nr:Uncharacterised protein [Klebsiella variicola]SAX24871.1 Uncharacterised protein [Klebsiella pneumoniae]SAY21394.1 Uncharacterised protein [Klebsiella pneumoniae]SBJ72800.1 Uncharacterised protein [Klebsiella pneumoniae]SVP33521.1 Uncharacterised protein [Klebsiella pneumoniae]
MKGIACRLAAGHAFDIPGGALITVIAGAANAPYPLLLLAIVIDKALMERQGIADDVAIDLNMEAAQLLAAAILHHPPCFGSALKIVKDVEGGLLLPVFGDLGAAAGEHQHQQRQAKGQNAFHGVPPINC